MGKIARIIELSYLQLVIIFLLLVLLRELKVLELPIYYPFFILILPLFALPFLLKSTPSQDERLPGVFIILAIVFIFALLLRLLPLINSPVPLGYDPGFYKYTLDLYTGAQPDIPETGLATWVRTMQPQGLPVLADAGYLIAGAAPVDFMRFLLTFIGALLVFPVFMLTRHLFGARAGIIAAVLYAVAYTQFEVFNYFYQVMKHKNC